MSTSPAADVLFLVSPALPKDVGDPSVYQPLRLTVGGLPAVLPVLRGLAAGTGADRLRSSLVQAAAYQPPVLTGFLVEQGLRSLGHTVACVPCLETHWDEVRRILAQGVRVVALSTTWLHDAEGAEALRRAAVALRALAPETPIVAGGVGVRKALRAQELAGRGELAELPAAALGRLFFLVDADRDRPIDAFVVSPDGIETLARIVAASKAGTDPFSVENLAIPGEGGYRYTPSAPERDFLHLPLDWRPFAAPLGPHEIPVRTGAGCPHQCSFCDFAGLYRPELRSPEEIVSELATIAAALPPPRRVFFTDDNLATPPRRLKELCRALIKAELGLSWRSFLRADAVDDEAADLMGRSGCCEALVGIESGDAQMLRNMRKSLDPDQALRAVERLDGRGIGTVSTFVVGFPGETAASAERTADLLSAFPAGPSANALHRYYLFRFQVAPLAPVARSAEREKFGLRGLGEEWAHHTMDAQEAKEAVREIFLRVRGPSHAYWELPPGEWPVRATRAVLEARDAHQKSCLRGEPADFDALLDLVRQAEAARATGIPVASP